MPAPIEISILYAGCLGPEPLSPEQTGHVLAEARALTPESEVIWFLLVLSNRSGSYRVEVYFAPDEQTEHLRKGRYLCVQDPETEKPFTNLRQSETQIDSGSGSDPGSRSQYLQVSAPDEPFGDRLSTPSLRLLPFRKPESINDSDVVSIVNLVRSRRHSADVRQDDAALTETSTFGDDLPIHRIEQSEDGLIIVRTGWQVGWLAGQGQVLRYRRTSHGFQALDGISNWVS